MALYAELAGIEKICLAIFFIFLRILKLIFFWNENEQNLLRNKGIERERNFAINLLKMLKRTELIPALDQIHFNFDQLLNLFCPKLMYFFNILKYLNNNLRLLFFHTPLGVSPIGVKNNKPFLTTRKHDF